MKKTIGFIGLGVMGKSMASHILNDGHPVLVYTRTKEKAESILQKGAIWKDTVKDLSKEADVIITMVGYPSDVEEVYFGSNGIIENAKEGAYLIDMTTSKPSLAKKIAEAAKEKALFALDAPVSGGDIGAQNGTLAIMVGGEKEASFLNNGMTAWWCWYVSGLSIISPVKTMRSGLDSLIVRMTVFKSSRVK